MEVDDNRANGGVGGSPANLHRQSGCIAADTSGTVLELVDVCEEFLFKFIKERIRVVIELVAGRNGFTRELCRHVHLSAQANAD